MYFNSENFIVQTFNIKLISISKQLKIVDCLESTPALVRLALSNQQNYEIETPCPLENLVDLFINPAVSDRTIIVKKSRKMLNEAVTISPSGYILHLD